MGVRRVRVGQTPAYDAYAPAKANDKSGQPVRGPTTNHRRKHETVKTKVNLLAAGLFLAALSTGFAQSTIQFTATTCTVAENAGLATVTVQRTGDTNTTVTVDYATANGTATAALDYSATNGTLTFAAGETNQTISVPILNDGLVEASYETFTVTLSNPTGGAALGTPATATVRITENDKGLQLEYSSYRVGEAEGFVLLGVMRGDDGEFPVSVDFATSDSTATNGLDYTATNGTLSFADGEKVKLFTVPILNDGLKEGSEYFRVTVSNPTNQVLGSQRTATVTIADNDAGVQFQPFNRYWIAENEGALTLTVVRGNDGNLDPITVDFATSDLTATNGLDYAGTNGTLNFAQGEMAKTLTVPILYDEVPEADKQFKVTLSNPTNAVLGPIATATVTILDTTGTAAHRFGDVSVLPDRSVQLTLEGGAHTRFRDYYDLYPIEVSSNLVDWTPLVTLQRTNADTNVLSYTDTAATNCATRFYRTPTNHLITPFSVKPTGPYAVGVISRLLTDPLRRNRYGLSTNGSFMVSVWYPAVPQAGRWLGSLLEARFAQDPYLSEGWAAAGYPTTPSVDRMPYFVGYALPDAPCATNHTPFPIVLCSHLGMGWRASFAEKAANLASHGYVVAVPDHVDVTATLFPDGTYLTPSTTGLTPAVFEDRLRDLTFVLDELTRWNTNDPVFAGRLDVANVAAVGGCCGYVAAAEFCRNDPRCRAAILVSCSVNRWPCLGSGGTVPDLDQFGVQKPFLGVYGETCGNYTWLFDKAAQDAIAFRISGTQVHGDNYLILTSDFYWFLYPNDLAVGREASRTITDYGLWFLNKYLKGSTDPMPAQADYPRIINFQQK